jgi:hypothetical protein
MKFISYSSGSKTSETAIWLIDGNRYICLTYEYSHGTGEIKYAATVFRPSAAMSDPDEKLCENMESTTSRRFEIRPVETIFAPFLNYNDILDSIRHEMCHGQGCKGPRIDMMVGVADDDGTSSISSDESFLSLESGEFSDDSEPYEVGPRTFQLKTIHRNQYDSHWRGGGETREIFICFKGSKSSGDLLYGASISHGPSDTYRKVSRKEGECHYATAMSRLNKCPVQMNVPHGYRHQLKIHTDHREDVVATVVDKIFERQNGCLQIRGGRI